MEKKKHYDIEGNPIWMTDEEWEKWRAWELKMIEAATPKITDDLKNKVIITGTHGDFENNDDISKWFYQPNKKGSLITRSPMCANI